MKLTAKQIKFCNEYLISLNATQAAINAGYSSRTAKSIANENLTKPDIIEFLNQLRKEIVDVTGTTPERIQKEYDRIAFFDPKFLFNENGTFKNIHEMDEDTVRGIAYIEIIEIKNKKGEVIGVVKKIKTCNKLSALDSLAKIHSMFGNNADVNPPLRVIIENYAGED